MNPLVNKDRKKTLPVKVWNHLIGGGFPVGAIAGKEDTMALFSPEANPALMHSGTFNGNPVTMTAGLETLKLLTGAEIDRINGYGAGLRNRIRNISNETGIRCFIETRKGFQVFVYIDLILLPQGGECARRQRQFYHNGPDLSRFDLVAVGVQDMDVPSRSRFGR